MPTAQPASPHLVTPLPIPLTAVPLTLLASLPFLMILSRQFSVIRYYTRLGLFLGGLASCSVWGVVVSIAYGLMGRRSDSNWKVARSFHAIVAPLVGWKFRVEGEEYLTEQQYKPAVVVGNHQTMIDILYLGKIFPKGCSIMAKKEIQYLPLLGQFMTLSNAVFINRTNRADAVAVFAQVAKKMKDKAVSLKDVGPFGMAADIRLYISLSFTHTLHPRFSPFSSQLSLFIFPEGTRSASATPTLLPFKKGAFHLAVAAQLPIVPIICENYAALYSAKEKRFDSGELVIKVLPPIPTTGLTSSSADIAILVEKTRNLMLDAIEELAQRRAEVNRLKAEKHGGGVVGLEAEERTPLVSGAAEQ
ncbi:lysophosphatidate acyltransferase, partial [Phenoliferia sp. Uapishka_3]